MSQRAIHFANDWISDAIDQRCAGVHCPSPAQIDGWIAGLVADAALEGIAREEIEAGFGDLASYIAACLAEAARRGPERG